MRIFTQNPLKIIKLWGVLSSYSDENAYFCNPRKGRYKK